MDNTANYEEEVLPIGTKWGCYTIIAGFEAYQEEKAKEHISKLEEEKLKFLNGEKSDWCNFDHVETFDKQIEEEKRKKYYKAQCKCGKIHFISSEFNKMKKRRYCGEECGLKLQREKEMIASYPREEASHYNIEFTNNTHESLYIVECVDNHLESEPIIYNKRKKGCGVVYLYKMFRCECYLCGKEHYFTSDQFEIRKDSYGPNATRGYYCNAFCDCHYISSFQWRTIKILTENKIAYRVEESFEDLLSENGNPLRYDFLIINPDGSTKCLIECQGEQHYKIGNGYGGYYALKNRQLRDEQKRKYAKEKNIPLIEIPYTYDTFEKEVEFLRINKVI